MRKLTVGEFGLVLSACAASDPTARSVLPPSPIVDHAGNPWSACLERVDTTGDPAVDVEKLGLSCGAESGQRALGPVRLGQQMAASATDRYTFHADEVGACFRVYAVGAPGVEEIGVELIDPDGSVVAANAVQGPRAAVPDREPLCVSNAGTYTVEVNVVSGGGAYALQVWTHRRK